MSQPGSMRSADVALRAEFFLHSDGGPYILQHQLMCHYSMPKVPGR
jgi:hypothetical protein